MNQLEFRKAVRQAKWTGSSPYVGGDRNYVDHAIHKFWRAATIARKLVELNRKHDLSIMTDDLAWEYPDPHRPGGLVGAPLKIAHCSVGRYDSSLFRLPGVVGEFDPIPADHEDFPQALDQAMVSLGELVNRTLLELLKPTQQADKEYFRQYSYPHLVVVARQRGSMQGMIPPEGSHTVEVEPGYDGEVGEYPQRNEVVAVSLAAVRLIRMLSPVVIPWQYCVKEHPTSCLIQGAKVACSMTLEVTGHVYQVPV